MTPTQMNILGALLLQTQPSHQAVGEQRQLPLAGLNMLPKLGVPAVQQGARLQPQLPLPTLYAPNQTRGEAATAYRESDPVGTALTGTI